MTTSVILANAMRTVNVLMETHAHNVSIGTATAGKQKFCAVRGNKSGIQHNITNSISVPGLIEPTNLPTNLAIEGDGYSMFPVRSIHGDMSASHVDSIFYTRIGDFVPNVDGYLVNSAGSALCGLPYAGGNIDNVELSRLEPINIYKLHRVTAPTTEIAMRGNLSATAKNDDVFTSTFDVYDSLSINHPIQLKWKKIDALKWKLTADPVIPDDVTSIQINGTDLIGTGIEIEFHDNGKPQSLPNGTLDIAWKNSSGNSKINMFLGTPDDDKDLATTDGLTSSGGHSHINVTQDGATAGSVVNVEIGHDGVCRAIYSNGSQEPVYTIMLANFADPDKLELHESGFIATRAAGKPQIVKPGTDGKGTIASSAKEGSNSDVVQEWNAFINAQHWGYAVLRMLSEAYKMQEKIVSS